MKIGKYEFDSLEQANSKIKGLGEEHSHTIVKLGNIVLEQGEYDEEGNVTKEAVYSLKYSVDAMWIGIDKHPYGWGTKAIEIESEGVHGFAGVCYQENKI
jgi:hypothetical protein